MAALPPPTEGIVDSLPFRAALRREKLAARMALDEERHATLTAAIEAHLAALLTALPPQTLAFCPPVRGEFDARHLVSRLIDRGWHAAMPVVEAANAPMRFRVWTPATTMRTGVHGIPVPADGEAVVPAIVLLPLVAFDRRGFRLGYGGGYFDRTLAALTPRPLAFGVGFELARVDDIRPQTHDMPLDAVITEAGVMRCN
jgi:5,10-methenyltetrahydrofolate synthetase